jgi:hypothetical protein
MTVAVKAAMVELGPTNRRRELPSHAYASTASGTEYRPYCAGTPAMVA